MKHTAIRVIAIGMLPWLIATSAFGADATLAEQKLDDADITSAVRTELILDDAATANGIDVSTKDGVVSLSGTVRNILAKERAGQIAEAIAGVRAVVNRIVVSPKVVRSDDELKERILAALRKDPATEMYEVAVSVENGVATLSGEVHSYAERELAETVAKSVRGITDVSNVIDVQLLEHRSDKEIKDEILARLKNNVRVDEHLLLLDVKDGKAILDGFAGSLQEKNQAYLDAWVAGVHEVDASGIKVVWWSRDEMRDMDVAVSRPDNEVADAVRDAWAYDPRVESDGINVDVSDGTATLTGSVNDLRARHAAEEDARNTIGVWRIVSHLSVRPPAVPDETIERNVELALLESPWVERFDIAVAVDDGWVTLSGKVDTFHEKYQAAQAVHALKGVAGLRNDIEVSRRWVRKSDLDLKRSVEEQLFWSVFVDSTDIDVSVRNGVVTLTGTADTVSEYDEAEINAYQAGAKDVVNQLEVREPRYHGPHGTFSYGGLYVPVGGYFVPYYHFWE